MKEVDEQKEKRRVGKRWRKRGDREMKKRKK